MVNKDDIIKDILLEISYRSDEGYPNFSKPAHISILSEVLTEMGLTDVKYERIKNLLEEDKDETFTAKSKESGKVVPFKSKEARDAAIEAGTHEKTDKKVDDPKKKQSGKVTAKDFADRTDVIKKKKKKKTTIKSNKDVKIEVDTIQSDLQQKRDMGTAGAGGPVASQGESRYCNTMNTFKESDFKEKNKKSIAERQRGFDRKKTATETRTAEALGLDPNSEEFNNYLETLNNLSF